MQSKKEYTKIKNETFTIEKAIQRLEWRFKNENVKVGESKLTINELDQKAIDFIIQWHNKNNTQTLHENLLFAKCFSYALNLELQHFKNIKIALSNLEFKLKMPIEFHYDKIVDLLNLQELSDYEDFIGLEVKHPYQRNENENNEIKEKLKSDSKYWKYIAGINDPKKIYISLNRTINKLLNEIKK